MKTPSNDLSLILDEIDWMSDEEECLAIKPALVKALRRAMTEFDFEHVFSPYQYKLKSELTSILNQGRAKP